MENGVPWSNHPLRHGDCGILLDAGTQHQATPHPSSMEDGVPWTTHGVLIAADKGIPMAVKDDTNFVAAITPRRNEYHNGVLIYGILFFTGNATGITPRKNEYHDGISLYTGSATGITPRTNEYHENADSAKITPQKNEIFNLAPVVTNRCDFTGITPWDAPNDDPLPSKLEDGVHWDVTD